MYFLQGISNGTVIIFCVMMHQYIKFRNISQWNWPGKLSVNIHTHVNRNCWTGVCRLGNMWPGCLNHGRSACETFCWANHLLCARWQMILASISWCFKLYAAFNKFHLIRTRCHFWCVCAIHQQEPVGPNPEPLSEASLDPALSKFLPQPADEFRDSWCTLPTMPHSEMSPVKTNPRWHVYNSAGIIPARQLLALWCRWQ